MVRNHNLWERQILFRDDGPNKDPALPTVPACLSSLAKITGRAKLAKKVILAIVISAMYETEVK